MLMLMLMLMLAHNAHAQCSRTMPMYNRKNTRGLITADTVFHPYLSVGMSCRSEAPSFVPHGLLTIRR